jgi:hypothetical protein
VKKFLINVVACAAVVASVSIAAPASAHDQGGWPPVTAGTPATLTSGLVSPLSLEVDKGGVAYVSENFAGLVTRINSHGNTSNIATTEGLETSAVSTRKGTVYWAETAQDHSSSVLMSRDRHGHVRQIADLWAHENSTNPDQVNHYGFEGLDAACLAQFPPAGPMMNAASYNGIVDTHPYSSLALHDAIYVADAGANAILRVGYDGTVSTVAVLKPTAPLLVTAEMAAGAGFPSCSVGHNYRFEPVPTDVELGPDGWLYVTSLPGGPEDASLGARGTVQKVNPHNGHIKIVAKGFVGATGLAISDKGTIFVAELFGGENGAGQVSVVKRGAKTGTPLIKLSQPAAIELLGSKLYVTTDVLSETGAGAITIVPLKTHGGHGRI